MIGTTLLHYEILRKLGAGGMGEVYLARDTKLGREVAIKTLPPQWSSDPGRLERFRREASAVAALNHPNIVTIHSVEEADDLHFFTMEFIGGSTLADLVPEDGLPPARFLELAVPLVDAVTAAHERGVTHRDLKPRNIMVSPDGRLKVLDFGLAKVRIAETPGVGEDSLAETELLTGDGQILGTTPYMSPEQLTGRRADARSDIFALGTVLYLMATGRHPFRADSSAEVISSILSHAPPRVSTVKPHLPDELGGLIGRCLEKDPAQRFQTADELRRALEKIELEPGDRETATRIQPRGSANRRRHSRRRAVIGIALAAGAALTAGLLWLRHTRSAPVPDLRSVAVLPLANMTGDPELDHLAEAVSAGLINSLREVDGLRVIGRTQAWSLRDRSPGELLEELAVGAVVDGEIQRDAGGLRTTVGVTDAATGFVLWSHTYSATPDQAFRSEQAIAGDIAVFLAIPLTTEDRRRLARDPGGAHLAHDYYVTGQRFLDAVDDPHGPDSAAENFRQALRIDPDFALAHVGLSEAMWQIYHRDHEPQALTEARDQAEAARRIDPDSPAVQVAAARIHRTTGHHDAAIEELEDVLARHPRPDRAYRELARSYERVGNLEEAEKSLRAAAALRPNDWSNWNALGTFLAKQGRYDEARVTFVRASDLAPPDITRPVEQLATISLAMGDFDDAIDAYESIPEVNRGPALASNLGTAYFFSDRTDKWVRAEESYLLAVKLSPKDALYQANLGDLYAGLGRPEQAQERYLRARSLVEERVREDPDNPSLLTELADYSAKGRDCRTALSLTGELRRVLPETGPTAHQLAYIYALCGEDDAAMAAIRQAVELGEPADIIRQEAEFRELRSRSDFPALFD